MNVSPYLQFNGKCEEAFGFYAKTFRGEVIALMRWSQMPGENKNADMKDKIMHAHLKLGSYDILGSDAPPAYYGKPQGMNVAVGVDSNEEAERVFGALSEGGEVTMAMAETFFAHRFGQVTDRYGIRWMILHGKN
jgi:PhnB protein